MFLLSDDFYSFTLSINFSLNLARTDESSTAIVEISKGGIPYSSPLESSRLRSYLYKDLFTSREGKKGYREQTVGAFFIITIYRLSMALKCSCNPRSKNVIA